MKKIYLFLFLLLGLATVQAQSLQGPDAQNVKAGPPEPLDVKELEFDFGTIPQGKPVYHAFQVVNKGATPLKLDNVQATCGCTTPEWSKEPIAPGASDKIKVGYNAAAEGPFEKYITITYNGNTTKQIKIKGTVWKAPAGSAPLNASINFLKQQMQ
ncbi:MAG TPA: DUF1573 domain-containing protein [Flavisolibacter sp.]|nr:DUF1573 domain-containing protein [Flavisolibacter sp.]